MQKAQRIPAAAQPFATAQAINIGRVSPRLPVDLSNIETGGRPPVANAVDVAGRPLTQEQVRRVDIPGYPSCRHRRQGIPARRPRCALLARFSPAGAASGNPAARIRSVPTLVNGAAGVGNPDVDLRKAQTQVFSKVMEAARTAVAAPNRSLVEGLREAVKDVEGVEIFEFWPTVRIEEALSPIGMPTTTGSSTSTRRKASVHSRRLSRLRRSRRSRSSTRPPAGRSTRSVEEGLETVSESAVETKNLDEVSDKVSSMVQRDALRPCRRARRGRLACGRPAAPSSTSMSVSSQRGREEATRRVKEVTRRASERITKSFTIKTRDFEEITTTSLTRRVIRNESAHP